MRCWKISSVSWVLLVFAASVVSAGAQEKGWIKLFNGKNLEGWEQRNGTATYRVEDKCVVGKTNEGSPNSFLCTLKEYSDFELKFEVKVDDQLNSGVQIRSKTKGDTKDGRVHGPQVEIATNGTAGFIYGEALNTGWLSKDRKDPKKNAAFKKGEWNKYHVKAVGKHIQTWVNGVQVADLMDTESEMSKGFIGLQVHGIRKGTGPYEVRWKNIYLMDLSKLIRVSLRRFFWRSLLAEGTSAFRGRGDARQKTPTERFRYPPLTSTDFLEEIAKEFNHETLEVVFGLFLNLDLFRPGNGWSRQNQGPDCGRPEQSQLERHNPISQVSIGEHGKIYR